MRFVAAYADCLNATKAALEAGYAKASAHVTGSRMLALPHIRRELSKLQKTRVEVAEITADRVIRELHIMATWDAGWFSAYELESHKDFAKLPEHLSRAIVGWKYDKLGKLVIQLADKARALEMLGRHFGSFNADTSGPQQLVSFTIERADDKPMIEGKPAPE